MRGNPDATTDGKKISNRPILVQTDRVRLGYCFTLHITHKKNKYAIFITSVNRNKQLTLLTPLI